MSNDDFESVIPTAILTAYPRTLADIPFAKEVFNELKKDKIADNLIVDKLAPEIEARFKLINNLLNESKVSQVLEIAAGYSTRGLELAGNDNQISYVELDLPEVCNKKIDILNSFIKIPDNLHILPGNALEEKDINEAEKYLDKGSEIAVINEGLLRYLNFDEKRQVATNIHKLLSKYSGVWITCDVTPKKFIANQDANLANFNKNLSNISDRNNANWRFKDINHVKEFFGQVGFAIESVHPFSEVKDELTSPEKLNLNSTQVDDLLRDAIVVVMRA